MRFDTHTWTDAEDREIIRLAKLNFSASEIARQLPFQPSRNAVIGRLSRIRFKNPNGKSFREKQENYCHSIVNRPKRVKPPTIVQKLFQDAPTASKDSRTEEIPCGGISLLKAGHQSCRWILEGLDENHMPRCCGEQTIGKFLWCLEHARKVFAPHTIKEPVRPVPDIVKVERVA